MHITYGTIEQSRAAIIDHIASARAMNPGYRVIDLGGVAGEGWSNEHVDMIVDINAPKSDAKCLRIDLCRPETWDPLWADIKKNGQYDFAICNHTLEDLYNPFPVLDALGKIARRGMITTPSINTELSWPESPDWRGYCHHRWIFEQTSDQTMLVVPKLGLLEQSKELIANYHPALQEIRFEWIENIPYSEFMGNYITGVDLYCMGVSNIWLSFVSRFKSN